MPLWKRILRFGCHILLTLLLSFELPFVLYSVLKLLTGGFHSMLLWCSIYRRRATCSITQPNLFRGGASDSLSSPF